MIEPNKTDDMDENSVPKGDEGSSQDMAETTRAQGFGGTCQDISEREVAVLCELTEIIKICDMQEEEKPEIPKVTDIPSREKEEENQATLELTDHEDTNENTETKRDIQDKIRMIGNYLYRNGRELQILQTSESNERGEERKWITNVEKHGWLKEPPSNLKVEERTVDMEQRIKQLEKEQEIYRVKEDDKNMCIIVGNTTYKNKRKLDGCTKDCLYLANLFKQLNFEVELKENLTAKELETFLTDQKTNLGNVKCFVCAITGHGNNEGVLGIDREVTSFQTILDMFDRNNCPQLAERPKVFLFDVCRGKSEDVAKTSVLMEETYDMIPPLKSDVLVAHATSYDYVSFCHRQYGSWFCRSFVKVVSESACKYSILDMLLMVNKLVGTFTSEDGCMQSARFDCSMRKQFFFPLQVREKATNEQSMSKPVQVQSTGL